ncbi:MAG: hypothetical protein ACO331_11990 [Prochlorothrix sp.]
MAFLAIIQKPKVLINQYLQPDRPPFYTHSPSPPFHSGQLTHGKPIAG